MWYLLIFSKFQKFLLCFHGVSGWDLLFQIESGIELIWMFEVLSLLQSLLRKGHGGIDLDGYTVMPGRYYYIYMKGTWPLCYSIHSSAYRSLIYHLATSLSIKCYIASTITVVHVFSWKLAELAPLPTLLVVLNSW